LFLGFLPSQKKGRKLNPPAAENNSLIALQVVLEYHHYCWAKFESIYFSSERNKAFCLSARKAKYNILIIQ
jgi:hypothetical protein